MQYIEDESISVYRGWQIVIQSATNAQRIAQEALIVFCSKKSSPVIALGDFNSTPTGLAKSEVTQSGKNAMSFLFGEKGFISYLEKEDENHIYTFPSEKPDRLIDWIIGKGIRNFSNSRVVRSKLSDHLMIVTEVEI